VAAVKNHLFTADLTAQWLASDFIGRAGDVPGVLGVHGDSPRLFVVI
jgi:hypothetical protein